MDSLLKTSFSEALLLNTQSAQSEKEPISKEEKVRQWKLEAAISGTAVTFSDNVISAQNEILPLTSTISSSVVSPTLNVVTFPSASLISHIPSSLSSTSPPEVEVIKVVETGKVPKWILEWKRNNSFEKRFSKTQEILLRDKDSRTERSIPIRIGTESSDLKIVKCNFNVPSSYSIAMFNKFIRDKAYIDINESKAIFTMVQNRMLPCMSDSLAKLYNEYKDEDGFLYITYFTENAFGAR